MAEPTPVTPNADRVAVRPAVHRDARGVRDLLGELGYAMSPDDVHARLRAVESERSTKILVADDGGEVVGLAVVHWFELLERRGPFARLLALVVADRYRGTGVGRRLVESSEGIARRAGCLGIEVTTATGRGRAQAFYERMGYVTGTSRYYRKSFE